MVNILDPASLQTCASSPRFLQTHNNIYRCRIEIHCSAYKPGASLYSRLSS
jgi:hypothetical protein